MVTSASGKRALIRRAISWESMGIRRVSGEDTVEPMIGDRPPATAQASPKGKLSNRMGQNRLFSRGAHVARQPVLVGRAQLAQRQSYLILERQRLAANAADHPRR